MVYGHVVWEVGGSKPNCGNFPSNQATGKVFSIEYAIYGKLKIYLKSVPVVKLQTI